MGESAIISSSVKLGGWQCIHVADPTWFSCLGREYRRPWQDSGDHHFVLGHSLAVLCCCSLFFEKVRMWHRRNWMQQKTWVHLWLCRCLRPNSAWRHHSFQRQGLLNEDYISFKFWKYWRYYKSYFITRLYEEFKRGFNKLFLSLTIY